MDDTPIKLSVIFGRIEIHNLPPRIEGNDLIPRTRHVTYDGDGNITKDEVTEGPLRLINGAPYAYLFMR